MMLMDCSSYSIEKPTDRAVQWFLYYEPKGGHQFKIMVASSVCGEVVFISPTIGTSTPRTGDSGVLAKMIGKFICNWCLYLQLTVYFSSQFSYTIIAGDDLIRLKKGLPLQIGIIHLLSGTSKYVPFTSSLDFHTWQPKLY